MFVRFRQSSTDGYASRHIVWQQQAVACCGRCRGPNCSAKPRCRWRIGHQHNLTLQSYRLHVQVMVSRRVDGKPRQEILADLGTIDGVLLPDFWRAVDPAIVAQVREPSWDTASIRARMEFWNAAKPRLERLANRLGPDLKRIRMAVHARVPWPMQAERDRLPLLEADSEAAEARSGYETATKMVEDIDRALETATKQKRELSELAMWEAKRMAKTAQRAARLREATAALEKPSTQVG